MSFTLQTFLDRVFLTWYSADAVAGAITGLFLTWSLISLFLSTAEYTGTFVAQYHGAQWPHRIGPALWQGIYFAAIAGLVIAGISPFAKDIFDVAGHDPRVRHYEVEFASLLMRGAFPVVLMGTLSTFFAGRGETLVVLRVNILATFTNVVLDYAWIFGNLGFPRAGVRGAALATITSQTLGCLVYAALIFRKRARERYATLSGWRFDASMFGRLLRYGFPSGLQVSLEILAFGLFLVLVGRLGNVELAATGLAFNLNGVVWVPMVGLGLGVSSIVGRYQGARQPELSERTIYSAIAIALAYMCLCSSGYFLAPKYLLAPYRANADPATFAVLERLASVLLRFVAVYSVFDMVNLMCTSGLRGAGDTGFAMRATIGIGFLAMLVPTYVACTFLGAGIYTAWCFASLYPFLLGVLLFRRFRAGAWKGLRVIEQEPPLPSVSETT